MKSIGIVTFHRSHNYGSAFLAYAMVKVMESFGLNVKVIDFEHPESRLMYDFVLWNPHKTLWQNIHSFVSMGILGRRRKRRLAFHRFVRKNIPLTRKYRSRFDIKEHFDYLVCGSDQIWNPAAIDSRDDIYFLDFGDARTVKFSYAASSGSRKICSVDESRTELLLLSLKKIGVREEFMKNYIRDTYGLDSTVNPDPTILLPADEWVKLEESVGNLPSRYLLVYTLENVSETVNVAAQIGKKMGLPVVHINNEQNIKSKRKAGADISLFNVSPGQFLWLFHHASFVVSNSFHGNMFSIIFRKDFVCPMFDFKDTRMETLHEHIGLGRTRFVSNASEFNLSDGHIDYAPLEENIVRFREEGFEFIRKCL